MDASPEAPHTVKRYDAELARLLGLVAEMGDMVAEQISFAVQALVRQDTGAARNVIDRDHLVNGIDVVADEVAVNLLALRQPMGSDLRLIMAASKTVTDLERIGDEAKKIARLAIRIYDGEGRGSPRIELFRDVRAMELLASHMLRGSLDALKHRDFDKAVEVVKGDRELDKEFQSALRRLTTYIMDDHRNIGHVIDVVFIVKALERIGDHSKNIAEYVVYLLKGKHVRHVGADAIREDELDAD